MLVHPINSADHPVRLPGDDTESPMADDVKQLNRRYVAAIRRRTLCHAGEVDGWRGADVNVFLRHGDDHVFAVAAHYQIGMADFVAVEQARFRVDEAGRCLANRRAGTLPNGRNVHAFVRGRLLWADMKGKQPHSDLWRPVEYNPAVMTSFQIADSDLPVTAAEFVLFTPGRVKVWCVHPQTLQEEVDAT